MISDAGQRIGEPSLRIDAVEFGGHWLAVCVLAVMIFSGLCFLGPVTATPQQAPNSRVVLDLPPSYTPSTQFSGFQNEALGVSLIVAEFPISAYESFVQGFTSDALAKRGIVDVVKAQLARKGPHVYIHARQSTSAGIYAKYFLILNTSDQTLLVTVNVPAKAIKDGSVEPEDIERILATAKTTEKPVVRDLFSLSYLGPFKEAGSLTGTTKIYSLDRRLEPSPKGEMQSFFMVAPSIDKRPIPELRKTALALLASLQGFKDVKPSEMREVRIDGLEGIEVSADAIDGYSGNTFRLYQAMLLGKDGGYFRLIGVTTAEDALRLEPEFPKIAASFTLLQ